MQKILKIVEVKKQIRQKEIEDADMQAEDSDDVDQKVFKKDKAIEKIDDFFAQESDGDKEVRVEKRAVLRDGRIPKFQKNVEKIR